LSRNLGEALGASLAPAILDCNSAPVVPAEFTQPLLEGSSPWAPDRSRAGAQKTDGRQLARLLLPARRERPGRRPAEQRDELAPLHLRAHWITSSARPRSDSGIVSPSALAVLRLMISSTLVACWTGRSAGFSPLSIRPVWMLA